MRGALNAPCLAYILKRGVTPQYTPLVIYIVISKGGCIE